VPLPRALGRFNRRVTNRILGPLLTRLPWFVWLEHVGRSSGRRYRTPVMLFGSRDGMVMAMTYGPDTDWAKNMVVAGGATAIATGGRRIDLVQPRIVHDPSRRLVPLPVRPVLIAIRAADFLVCKVSPAVHEDPGSGPG
jgi:deazaflavin-dependent oxidoreductase (nitroreductase family)